MYGKKKYKISLYCRTEQFLSVWICLDYGSQTAWLVMLSLTRASKIPENAAGKTAVLIYVNTNELCWWGDLRNACWEGGQHV